MVNKAGFQHTLEPEAPRNDAADPTGLNTDGPQTAGEKREGRPVDAAVSKRAKKEETGPRIAGLEVVPNAGEGNCLFNASPTHFGCDTRATSRSGSFEGPCGYPPAKVP